jgi:SAM-dependent methyltransferase
MADGAEAAGYDAEFVKHLYRVFFDREPDPCGFQTHMIALRSGVRPHDLVASFLRSDEFISRRSHIIVPPYDLPNLKLTFPDHYRDDVYLAFNSHRINLMEKLILENHYYDSLGVWSSVIDNDKLNIAQLVLSTGAKNCLEVGCFNGPVLSVLRDRGVEITGVDLSHLAFVLAFPNIRTRLLYGDLLTVNLDQTYDCILLLDIMEHLNPLRLGQHISRLREVLEPGGLIIMNSPMFGFDPVFGTVFKQNFQEWRDVGDREFYREWPCDKNGWPMHGHMIWASPGWWTRQFDGYDLIRQREIEQAIQRDLGEYFAGAPARRTLAVFSHRQAVIDSARICRRIHEQCWP